MGKKFVTWLLIFIGLTLVLQNFRQTDTSTEPASDDFILKTSESSYTRGESVILNIENTLDKTVWLESECPAEPLMVQFYRNGVLEDLSVPKGLYVSCEGEESEHQGSRVFFSQPSRFEFRPGKKTSIDYSPWKDELFSELGRYRITLNVVVDGVDKAFWTEFDIEERGFFSSIMYDLFLRPIYNFLFFLTNILPGHNFGLAIVVLTILIRLILLVPNQKALKSQRMMMKIQPELEAIKRKYKGNQEMISKETMVLWKKHKVNPVGGCLPLLIQLPVLIALFYAVKKGFSPYQANMIYESLPALDLTLVSTDFFGILDLRIVNSNWLPLLVGLLQFAQMKLSFSRRKISMSQAPHGKEIVDIGEKDKHAKSSSAPANPMKMMNKTMVYFMPLIIAFMVASLPSGVGLYLVVSTLFGISQQFFVNRS